MFVFIAGFLLVVFSKATGVRIFGMIIEVIGIFFIISNERTKAAIRCHMETCPGCYEHNH